MEPRPYIGTFERTALSAPEAGSWFQEQALVLLLMSILLSPLLVIVAVLGCLRSMLPVGASSSTDAFDDLFTIEYTDLSTSTRFSIDKRMFMDLPAVLLSRGVQVFTLLGVVFVRVAMSISGRLLLFIPELLFVIPVLTPDFIFRSRGPACPHIPRPPPAFGNA